MKHLTKNNGKHGLVAYGLWFSLNGAEQIVQKIFIP